MIHPSAVIEPGALLDEDVEIGPFTVIHSGARIGAGTIIGPHVEIHGQVSIGKRNRIKSGAIIGGAPQSIGFDREDTFVEIGDDNMIGEHATIHRATHAGQSTRVGNGCFLMSYSHVGHDCKVGNLVIMTNYSGLAGHVEVEDRAVFGGYSGVHQYTRVGCMAMLGGGSLVGMDVTPYTIVQGYPAVPVATNVLGMRRGGVPAERRDAVKKIYKIFFRSGLDTKEAALRAKDEVPACEELEHFLRFVEGSKRGICK